MTALTALWLPILVSAVIVFIASSLIHMLPLWHRKDFPPFPDQERLLDTLAPFRLPAGDYMLPRAANMKEMQTPEFKSKLERGPIMIATVIPHTRMGMARPMILWFLFIVVNHFFAAYVAGRALGPAADYRDVFRFIGAVAFIGYVMALWQHSIWYHRAWSSVIKDTFDGLIYALLAAGTFGWLWPR